MSNTDTPVILEVDINGVNTKDRNPHTPLSPEEIRNDSRACFDAGASIVRAHNSDLYLGPQQAAQEYLAAWRPLLAEYPGALWYPVASLSADQTKDASSLGLITAQVPVRLIAVVPGVTLH